MMIHPYLSRELARQHHAELTAAAEARRLSRAARRGGRDDVGRDPATVRLPEPRAATPGIRLDAAETVAADLCLMGGDAA